MEGDFDKVRFSQASATAAANTIATATANTISKPQQAKRCDNISAFVGVHLGLIGVFTTAHVNVGTFFHEDIAEELVCSLEGEFGVLPIGEGSDS